MFDLVGLFISTQVVMHMSEANLDGNGYWYPLKNHDDDNDPLVPPTPNQSPHNSFRFKGPRGPGEPATEQGMNDVGNADEEKVTVKFFGYFTTAK